MIFLYWLMLLFGFILSVILLVRQRRVFRQKKIIERAQNDVDKKILAKIDYKELIVKNGRWLTMLDNLDKQIIQKLRMCGAVGLFMLLMNFTGILSISTRSLAMIMLLVLVLIIILPGLLLKPAINTRIKLMMDSLPYFIDLIAVCIQSGMTVETALKYIGERFGHLDANLSNLILLVVKKAEVSGLEESLNELYRSIDLTEMRMFTATLQQSVHYGTSLYENLMELSKDIRELQLLVTEEKIGSLSAKMSVPLILFIMFPITILIAAPGILRILKNGFF